MQLIVRNTRIVQYVVGYKRTLVSDLFFKKKLFKCALVISLVMDGKKSKLGQ